MLKNQNIIDRWIVRTQLLCVLCLFLAWIATYLSPSSWSFLALFGLAFPVAAFINVLYLAFWIYRKKWFFLLSLLAIVLLWKQHSHWFQFPTKKTELNGGKLMSYNVRIFDLYEWHNKKGETKQQMLDLFKTENPEIICFQEFMVSANDSTNQWTDTLKHKLGFTHQALSLIKPEGKAARYGLAVFSKHPIKIIKPMTLYPEGMPFAQVVDIKTHKGNFLKVINVHLASIHFKDEDYRFIKNLKAQEHLANGGIRIISRLLHAFELRAQQVALIKTEIANSPYPTVLVGDFNDSPVSYTYAQLSENMIDAFMQSGSGIGTTYTGDFPSFRIDYVFHSNNIKSAQFNIIKKELSDHYPITVELDVLKH
ncbi:MAG: endonuclease/exonuclease/phosphatase family metal-dependent hydrolase [Flavobacteriales bacterium]